jgi:hypothetical protein
MTESSASGTSFTGKKAFATVTKVKVSADVTALTVGTGNVLGLPDLLPEAALVVIKRTAGRRRSRRPAPPWPADHGRDGDHRRRARHLHAERDAGRLQGVPAGRGPAGSDRHRRHAG